MRATTEKARCTKCRKEIEDGSFHQCSDMTYGHSQHGNPFIADNDKWSSGRYDIEDIGARIIEWEREAKRSYDQELFFKCVIELRASLAREKIAIEALEKIAIGKMPDHVNEVEPGYLMHSAREALKKIEAMK